jgi:hypothetical protein
MYADFATQRLVRIVNATELLIRQEVWHEHPTSSQSASKSVKLVAAQISLGIRCLKQEGRYSP